VWAHNDADNSDAWRDTSRWSTRLVYRKVKSCGKTSGAGMHKGITGTDMVDPAACGRTTLEAGRMGRFAQ
jgi:hypothetical protein